MTSFTTDFEEGLINGFLFTFKDKINDLHHCGCFFHYLQSCRRKLASLHLTKKINKKIDDAFMDTFVYYSFKKLFLKKEY